MKLFNTLSRKKELFSPINPNDVRLYSCGLTVYEEPHIGNWSTYIAWDLLVRVLRDTGYHVNHVQNYTDVGHLTSDEDTGEDKLIHTARKQRKTAWEVADYYIGRAEIGMHALNIIPATKMPRATDYIPQQIAFVEKLQKLGYVYTIDKEGLYFDTSKVADYGKLAQLDIAGLRFGERVATTGKRNGTDFAVWKFSHAHEKRDMEWDSPWGKGFPGWHLECSVMSRILLGDEIDIHTGGIDHIPIHHTNEIAQTEAITGKTFARYWLHRNFIKVDGHKMSKSRNNFYTLDDLYKRGFSALDFRLLVLQSTYHTESNFSWENMESAKQRRIGLQAFADLRFQPQPNGIDTKTIDKAKLAIQEALRDDLNSPEALAVLSQLESEASLRGISSGEHFSEFIHWLDEVFGLGLLQSQDITDKQKALLSQRLQARQNKHWEQADSLRDQLLDQKIALRDTNDTQFWNRIEV